MLKNASRLPKLLSLSFPLHRLASTSATYRIEKDAIKQLRPLIRAVHPDIFGQHPNLKEENENSLKKLFAYISSLSKPNQGLRSVMLKFNMKLSGENELRKREFRVSERSVNDLVLSVLRSCGFHEEHEKLLGEVQRMVRVEHSKKVTDVVINDDLDLGIFLDKFAEEMKLQKRQDQSLRLVKV